MRTAVLAEGCATPAYPASAARNGETGTVLLALLIGSDGKVSDSKVQKSSGHPALDKAARNALSLCRFKAATVDGVATAGWSAISYVWKLD
jgi:protein TonB